MKVAIKDFDVKMESKITELSSKCMIPMIIFWAIAFLPRPGWYGAKVRQAERREKRLAGRSSLTIWKSGKRLSRAK
jgi:hypothetical protein